MRAARDAGMLPYFHEVESPAMPIVQMDGAPRIMLGSNNYLGLTGDERVMQGARDALARYGTGLTGSRLLNGTTPLHLELERELAEFMGTDDAIVFTTGHQANVGTIGTLLGPGDTVVVDSGDHASLLDGAILSRAKLRAFRHNRLDKLESTLAKAAGDGGGVLVVVDGVFSMEGDLAPLREITELCEPLRRAAAGRRGARRRRARRARRGHRRAARRRGPRRPAHGHVLEVARVLRRVHRRRRRGDRVPAASRAARSSSPPSGVPAAIGAALAALRVIRSAEGRELIARVLANGRRLNRGLHELGFDVVEPSPVTNADGAQELIITPIVPVRVGEDWKAGLLWRALWDAGRLHQRRRAPGGPAGRRAAADERDGDPRRRGARPRARDLRHGQARVRARARTPARARRTDCAARHKYGPGRKTSL